MKLPKQTRKRLFAGEIVELDYPKSENPPTRTGASYSMEAGDARCRVLRQRRVSAGWKVAIAHDIQEPPRLLAKSGADYTNSPYRALQGIPGGEPEAVDEVTQRRITKSSRDNAHDRRDEQRLEREQRSLEARIGIAIKVAEVKGVDISKQVGIMERALVNVERRLEERNVEAAA